MVLMMLHGVDTLPACRDLTPVSTCTLNLTWVIKGVLVPKGNRLIVVLDGKSKLLIPQQAEIWQLYIFLI